MHKGKGTSQGEQRLEFGKGLSCLWTLAPEEVQGAGSQTLEDGRDARLVRGTGECQVGLLAGE